MLTDGRKKEQETRYRATSDEKGIIIFFLDFEAGGETPSDWQWGQQKAFKIGVASTITALPIPLRNHLHTTKTTIRDSGDTAPSPVVFLVAEMASPAKASAALNPRRTLNQQIDVA